MPRFPIPNPTQADAIGRTSTPKPTAPPVVLAGRALAAERNRDRLGRALLLCLIRRCSE